MKDFLTTYLNIAKKDSSMKYFAAKHNNHISFGSRSKIAKLIGVHSQTIKRWDKDKKEVVFKNGFEIYLNAGKL